jgi:glutathione S-transferase
MKLYVMPGACSLASHIALIWAGAEFELSVLSHDDAGGEAFAKINPKGCVPALMLKDGAVITESLAILDYIGDRFPDAKLGAFQDNLVQRAQLNELLAELVSDVHKAWAPVFVPQRFVVHERNQADAQQAAFIQLDARYNRLDALMKDKTWSLLGRRTVVDAYLYVMCAWKDKTPTPLSEFPSLNAFKTRLDEDALVQRALKDEGLV